jgi:hypothetical protein
MHYRNPRRTKAPQGGDHAGLLRDIPLDDTPFQVWLRERFIQCDAAFCKAMDAARAAALESCSTAICTAPGTKKPIYVSDGDIRFQRPDKQ